MKIFEENPNLDEVYQTSDDNLFFLLNTAENHAKTLEDKRVKRIVRPDAKNVAVVETKSQEPRTESQEVKTESQEPKTESQEPKNTKNSI